MEKFPAINTVRITTNLSIRRTFMKVFLSWSGDVSHKVSCIFRDWLPMVIQYVQPYVSSEDIDKGARWLTDIMKELETSYYGILFITRDNYNAPWLNFEAGALTKAVEKSRITPFLFGLGTTDFSGPLTQFQAATYDEIDIFKLLLSINRSSDDKEQLPEERLKKTFEVWWPEIKDRLQDLYSITQGHIEKPKLTKEQIILQEVLELVRSHQAILHTPEMLFPGEYFDRLFRECQTRLHHGSGDVQDAIRELERNFFLLKNEFDDLSPKIKGISKSKLRMIGSLIEKCNLRMKLLIEAFEA